jgi:hypothetical protein
MANDVSQHSGDRRIFTETSVASGWPIFTSDKSAARIDIALLASALFMQRFGLPFFGKFQTLDFVFCTLILGHQFAAGRLFIQYDRLLWYLVMALAATLSLLLNFNKSSITSYGLFLVIYFLCTLSRPSTPKQYKLTLQGFQFLVLIISCLAIAQFAAQFVLDGKKIIMFYNIFPAFLLPLPPIFDPSTVSGANTIIPLHTGSSLIKSNGIFLSEPSVLSQVTALGILIEIMEFDRPRYLFGMTLAFLLSYSGTGLITLLLFLPFASLRHGRAGLSALIVAIFALGCIAVGIIDLSVFLDRIGEFQNPVASGSLRFVSPLWLAAKYFDTASLQALLVGSGPGTAKTFGDTWYAATTPTWFKLIYEYGIIGSFIFVCLLASCLRKSRCPRSLLAGLIVMLVLGNGGSFINPTFLTFVIVLCMLNGPDLWRGRINEPVQHQSSHIAGPVMD